MMAGILGKRKRAVLMLGKKLEIVQSLETGALQKVVGEKFGVAKSTIADIWKDRQKISDIISASESPAFANRKRCCAKFNLVNKAGSGFASSARGALLSLAFFCKKKPAHSS